jgi:tRNA U34 2-thiouridine synthase MnmA/TrmU
MELEIKVRYRGKSTTGSLYVEQGKLKVMLKTPEWGIAPEQAVAIYNKRGLVGGGFIEA